MHTCTLQNELYLTVAHCRRLWPCVQVPGSFTAFRPTMAKKVPQTAAVPAASAFQVVHGSCLYGSMQS
jgi:hypothetical protein